MMKKLKFVALALIASLCASTFVACSNNDDDDDDAKKMAVLYYLSKNNIPAAKAFDLKTTDTGNALGAALAKLEKGAVLKSKVYDNIKVGVYEYTFSFFDYKYKMSYGTEKSVVRADDDTAYLTLKAQTTYKKDGYNNYSDGGCIIFNVKKDAKISITGKAASGEYARLRYALVDEDDNSTESSISFDSTLSLGKGLDYSEGVSFTNDEDGKCVIWNASDVDVIISEIKVEY